MQSTSPAPEQIPDYTAEPTMHWVIAFCILLLVVLGCNLDLLTGKVGPVWDAASYYRPLFTLLADHARAWRLLLWDPWINAGSPDFAEPGVGAASPILFLFGFLSRNDSIGFAAYWVSFWVFGGLGMLLLCKHLKAPSWGGLIAALGFVSCGFYTGHGEHTATIYSFSFVPWVIWRFDKGLTERRYWPMVETGVLWGLSGLGGYPQLVILDFLFLCMWSFGRIFVSQEAGKAPAPAKGKHPAWFALGALCVVAIVGTVVLSPSYLTFMRDLRGYTVRVGILDRNAALYSNLLPPKALSTFASPFLYLLNLPPHSIWPESDVSMSDIYMGVLVTVLGAAAMLRFSRWKMWLFVMAAFFLACSVGGHLPVRGWLYDLVPPTRFFRNPAYFRAYVIATMCILSALATREFDFLPDAGKYRRNLCVISGLIAIAACLSYVAVFHEAKLPLNFQEPSLYGAPFASLHFLVIWSSVVFIFLLWWRQLVSRRIIIIALLSLAVFDAASTIYISRFTLYSIYSEPWFSYMDTHHVASLDLMKQGLDRHLYPPVELGDFANDRNLAIKQPEMANYSNLFNQFFLQFVADPLLSNMAIGRSRMWFSDQPAWLPYSDRSFAAFSQESHRLGAPLFVLHARTEMENAGNRPTPANGPVPEEIIRSAPQVAPAEVDFVSYRPNALSVRYFAAKDGWLLVTDRWASGWTARVNGQTREIVGADFIFRAIPVTAGDNAIEFRYTSRGYFALIGISWGVMFIVGICDLWKLRRAWGRHQLA